VLPCTRCCVMPGDPPLRSNSICSIRLHGSLLAFRFPVLTRMAHLSLFLRPRPFLGCAFPVLPSATPFPLLGHSPLSFLETAIFTSFLVANGKCFSHGLPSPFSFLPSSRSSPLLTPVRYFGFLSAFTIDEGHIRPHSFLTSLSASYRFHSPLRVFFRCIPSRVSPTGAVMPALSPEKVCFRFLISSDSLFPPFRYLVWEVFFPRRLRPFFSIRRTWKVP